MDINTVRGLITILMIVTFLSLVVWAYSKKQKQPFDEAANLPFADEETNARTLNITETK